MTELRNTNFLIEVNKGKIPGHSLVHVRGENPAATTTNYDIWAGGINLTWLQSAATLEAISDSPDDTATGSGARTLTVFGLDSSWLPVTATITMNGTSASAATIQSFIRINEVYVTTVGTYTGANLGDITIRVSGAGSTQSFIEVNEGIDSNSHYTIPAGKTGYILKCAHTMDGNKEVTIHMVARENADDITVPYSSYYHIDHWEGIKDPFSEDFVANHILPEKTDVWLKGHGATSPHLNIKYAILLVDN